MKKNIKKTFWPPAAPWESTNSNPSQNHSRFNPMIQNWRPWPMEVLRHPSRAVTKLRQLIVEGLTGKICTFLLADLWLRYYHDMIVWLTGSQNLFLANQSCVVHVRIFNLDFWLIKNNNSNVLILYHLKELDVLYSV